MKHQNSSTHGNSGNNLIVPAAMVVGTALLAVCLVGAINWHWNSVLASLLGPFGFAVASCLLAWQEKHDIRAAILGFLVAYPPCIFFMVMVVGMSSVMDRLG